MYQELIVELRWAIEIGRVYIENEVSVLSSYQAAPCDGLLQQILHIFAFLKKNPKLIMYSDPGPAVIYPTSFTSSTSEGLRNQYRGAKEELPTDASKARGRAVKVTVFVDASQSSDKKTRKCHTGCSTHVFNYINSLPNVLDSTVACLLLYQIILARLTNLIYSV